MMRFFLESSLLLIVLLTAIIVLSTTDAFHVPPPSTSCCAQQRVAVAPGSDTTRLWMTTEQDEALSEKDAPLPRKEEIIKCPNCDLCDGSGRCV